MNIRLIAIPYDSGIRGWRMGAGPEHLLAAGAEDRLRAAGHEVGVERVELPADPPLREIRAAFDIAAQLSERVAAAGSAGALPIILAGNCATAVGTLAGLADYDPAIVWLDAHGDLNTPETTRSGMLDGMALAITTGRCWRDLAAGIPGFRAVPDPLVCLVGARDLDAGETALLEACVIKAVAPSDVSPDLSAALDDLRDQTTTAYLHIDLDVLDPGEGAVNAFSAPDGLRLAQVLEVIRSVRGRFRLGAAALTAYDPSYDADGRVSAAALAILTALAEPA
jgi:arginase